MARWTEDAVRQATILTEAACWQSSIEAVCRCGHSAIFDPHGLWWWFRQRSWDDSLTAAIGRFWCRRCVKNIGHRVRPIRLNLVPGSDADIQLPLPPQREWKRVVKRMRY